MLLIRYCFPIIWHSSWHIEAIRKKSTHEMIRKSVNSGKGENRGKGERMNLREFGRSDDISVLKQMKPFSMESDSNSEHLGARLNISGGKTYSVMAQVFSICQYNTF